MEHCLAGLFDQVSRFAEWALHPSLHRSFFEQTLFLIPVFPFLGFLLNGFFGKRFDRKVSGGIAVCAAFASFIWTVWCTQALSGELFSMETLAGPVQAETREALHAVYGAWISAPGFNCSFGLYFDRIASVMMLVVTGVGTLIHLYSMGYMEHDRSVPRYFAYLNLFLFTMSLLVLGDNLIVLFVGWEGVGLCSYLLIGFWFEDPKNAAAGMKAFVVNRIGDVGFILGIFTLIAVFGTVNYVSAPVHGKTPLPTAAESFVKLPAQPGLLDYGDALRMISSTHHAEGSTLTAGGAAPKPVSNLDLSQVAGAPMFSGWTITSVLTLACILLFIGAMGKSAQIPLYVWLPDAMAGPTPVSALIHAATMVTAGVYMICRLHGLFSASPYALQVVAVFGAATALMSALIGLTQLDIKKVLAYSTVSQLGYMFVALGTGAFSLGFFHLFTHAFFKALLFLGAGSVIHAMSGEQDMRYMGGLRKHMPRTFWTMLIGSAALMGVPFLAGWYSKDAILQNALAQYYETHSMVFLGVYAAAMLGALCTAFYTSRMIFLTFFGENRAKADVQAHIHESPPVMTMPLIVLAVFSLLAGLLWKGRFIVGAQSLGIWNAADLESEAFHHAHELNLVLALGVVIAGAGLAYWLYQSKRHVPDPAASKNYFYRLSLNKFYIDEIYDALITGPVKVGSEVLHWGFETLVVDLVLTGSGYLVLGVSSLLRRLQTGVLNGYALGILSGALLVLFFFLRRPF